MAENYLRALAFLKLDETQLASLERCLLTVIKRYRDGEKALRGRPARLQLLRCQIWRLCLCTNISRTCKQKERPHGKSSGELSDWCTGSI